MINSLYPCFRRWSESGSVYLISDTHFDDPDCKLMDQDWPPPDEHIRRLSHITKNDTLIHLGDVGEPGYLNKLRCKKVLIMGNHDQSGTKFEPYFDEIYTGPLIVGEKIILSHEPVDIPWAFNIHGHDHDMTHGFRSFRDRRLNLASNVVGYRAYSLGEIIKAGFLKNIPTIHRLTIDEASRKGGGML